MDLEDGYDLFPDSLDWNLERTIEEKDDETVHILSGIKSETGLPKLSELLNWKRNPRDTVRLQRDFTLHRESKLFGESIIFSAKFNSRNFDKRYGDIWEFVPEECQILEDDEMKSALSSEEVELLEEKFSLGVLQWNLARYEKRFVEAWDRLKDRNISMSDTSETTFSIVNAGWSDDLRMFINDLDVQDPNTTNLEWWEELRSVFLGRLIDIAGINSAELISRIADNLELEYQVAKDIDDDNFKVILILPGRITDSNGMVSENGAVAWDISGEDIKNADYVLHAECFDLNVIRISIAALISLFILRWIKALVWRKKKITPHE